ncbi:hypothetical protein Hypma_010767 [Hypsizygus marmoreus]|uniref:Uncharacterized protein n=1 Tax=Hypsizygus marmoreus TaxID=39966 RepID=A0A369JJ66_HYPMA|nr:hypothetical protein Hypma_010767 [Hypsizygus marmoreus]
MSQQLQYHHHQPQYIHYTGPSVHQVLNGNAGIAPQDTTRQPQPQVQHQQQQHQQQQQQSQAVGSAGAGASTVPLVATGDWTKDLVHLAKTAELKKHALTLQLHTAHILSAHASLQEKGKAIQDIREQRNKLESERTRLLNALREINEDRDKAEMMELSIDRECTEIRTKMNQLTEGEYAVAKNDVDRLRQELGQAPLPSLQQTLDEKAAQYLTERRLGGNDSGMKRSSEDVANIEGQPSAGKRPRGRPKGSKNRSKESMGGMM